LKGDKKPQTFLVAKVYVEIVLLFETLVAPAGTSFVVVEHGCSAAGRDLTVAVDAVC
jgi:hypothetical protein